MEPGPDLGIEAAPVRDDTAQDFATAHAAHGQECGRDSVGKELLERRGAVRGGEARVRKCDPYAMPQLQGVLARPHLPHREL